MGFSLTVEVLNQLMLLTQKKRSEQNLEVGLLDPILPELGGFDDFWATPKRERGSGPMWSTTDVIGAKGECDNLSY